MKSFLASSPALLNVTVGFHDLRHHSHLSHDALHMLLPQSSFGSKVGWVLIGRTGPADRPDCIDRPDHAAIKLPAGGGLQRTS